MADSRNVTPGNLPASLTSFIGREREIGEIVRFLAECRLLTLTGEGGCGKSRLALETARVVLEPFADGAWIVELAALSDVGLVPQAVAKALNVPEQARIPMSETLERALRPRVMLLVLDNCEHLLGACAQLAKRPPTGMPRPAHAGDEPGALGRPGGNVVARPIAVDARPRAPSAA